MSECLSKQEKRKIANQKYYQKQKEQKKDEPIEQPKPQHNNNNIDIQELMKIAYQNGQNSVKQSKPQYESESDSESDTDEELEQYVQMRIKKATEQQDRFLCKGKKKKHKYKENTSELWGTLQTEVMKYGMMLAVPILYKSVGGMLLKPQSGTSQQNSVPQYGF